MLPYWHCNEFKGSVWPKRKKKSQCSHLLLVVSNSLSFRWHCFKICLPTNQWRWVEFNYLFSVLWAPVINVHLPSSLGAQISKPEQWNQNDAWPDTRRLELNHLYFCDLGYFQIIFTLYYRFVPNEMSYCRLECDLPLQWYLSMQIISVFKCPGFDISVSNTLAVNGI